MKDICGVIIKTTTGKYYFKSDAIMDFGQSLAVLWRLGKICRNGKKEKHDMADIVCYVNNIHFICPLPLNF